MGEKVELWEMIFLGKQESPALSLEEPELLSMGCQDTLFIALIYTVDTKARWMIYCSVAVISL